MVVDDFSRFTWVNFIREKSDTFDVFKDLCTQLQREKDVAIVRIRSDHGTKFENSKFNEFCSTKGIKHKFSSPITPQQNVLWKGKIEPYKNQPELCFMQNICPITSGLKL